SRFRRKRFAPFFLRHAPVRCRCTAVPDQGVTRSRPTQPRPSPLPPLVVMMVCGLVKLRNHT
ncbi:Os01g0943700, partial [Oryza sativa Japonica Group]